MTDLKNVCTFGLLLLLFIGPGCSFFHPYDDVQQVVKTRSDALGVTGVSSCVFDSAGIIECVMHGWENRENGLKVRPSTQFLLASVSKIIVGIAVFQLVEAGLLDLDEDINSYLPFPVHHPASPETRMTPRMLLTHSSGIRDNWDVIDDEFTVVEPSATIPPSLASAMEGYLCPDGQWFSESNFTSKKPGATVEYSNVGVTLAAYLVEAVSSMSFEAYCEANIFGPLGVSVVWNPWEDSAEGVAAPYQDGVRKPRRRGSLFPVGFLACSAEDLSKVIRVFLGNGVSENVQLLDRSSVDQMLTLQNDFFGHVWIRSTYTLNDEHLWCHDGSLAGTHRTGVYLSRRDGIGVIYLSTGRFDFPRSYFEIMISLFARGRR